MENFTTLQVHERPVVVMDNGSGFTKMGFHGNALVSPFQQTAVCPMKSATMYVTRCVQKFALIPQCNFSCSQISSYPRPSALVAQRGGQQAQYPAQMTARSTLVMKPCRNTITASTIPFAMVWYVASTHLLAHGLKRVVRLLQGQRPVSPNAGEMLGSHGAFLAAEHPQARNF